MAESAQRPRRWLSKCSGSWQTSEGKDGCGVRSLLLLALLFGCARGGLAAVVREGLSGRLFAAAFPANF